MRAEAWDLSTPDVLVPRPRVPLEAVPTGDELGDPFVGRAEELALLGSVLREVRCGRPQVVRVEGPAGIGKTALVERFLQGQGDLTVLRCAGEREEALVGFGVVDQLFLGAGMTSVRVLGGRGAVLPYFEPNIVGGQILTFLAEHEPKGPVVLFVDDLQWADPESLRALLFALRRMADERVLALLGTREDPTGPAEGLCRLATRRAGTVLHLAALTLGDVRSLASSATTGPVPNDLTARLHAHTRGNPSHLRDVLAELAPESRCGWRPALPVPRAVTHRVRHLVGLCAPGPRRLVEAAAVLGDGSRLATAATLAGVDDPLATLEAASAVGLLEVRDDRAGRRVVFPDPLVQAAVYGQLGPARRVWLHLAAAELVDEDGARLRHRVAAADPPDGGLAVELTEFAQRQAAAGDWSGAAWALAEASRMSDAGPLRDLRLLQAVDLLAGTGDLGDADALAGDLAGMAPGALRDAVLGHRAVLDGRRDDADALLAGAWQRCDPARDPWTAGLVAERRALHSLGRMRPGAVVEWARRAASLAPPDGAPAGTAADALLGIGLVWSGRVQEGRTVGQPVPGRDAPPAADDDLADVMAGLPGALHADHGWIAHRVWGLVWLSRAGFEAGSWDEAGVAAARAVAVLEETGHEWLRPLARWAAVAVPAARGEWAVADEHARSASVGGGGYELTVVASGMAAAQVAAARGDHEAVLGALAPVVGLGSREGVDEPGLWPWQALYGDALVSVGRLAEAEAFLGPHEVSAAARGRRLGVAMLARVRGRLESAAGRVGAAEAAFGMGSAQLEGLSVPFESALSELAYGQVLRRHGHRRAAVQRLEAARDRFAALGAVPYVERCVRELGASGLEPSKRLDFDPGRLTAQESAVARLVAGGLSNRQVASELFVSVKTVQFHLTRIYSKLRVSSRVELAVTYAGTPELLAPDAHPGVAPATGAPGTPRRRRERPRR